jgi:hypothetical protein
MWEPRRLTTLWASTACYSFTFFTFVLFCADDTVVSVDPSSITLNHPPCSYFLNFIIFLFAVRTLHIISHPLLIPLSPHCFALLVGPFFAMQPSPFLPTSETDRMESKGIREGRIYMKKGAHFLFVLTPLSSPHPAALSADDVRSIKMRLRMESCLSELNVMAL